jgi:hypothetical protein
VVHRSCLYMSLSNDHFDTSLRPTVLTFVVAKECLLAPACCPVTLYLCNRSLRYIWPGRMVNVVPWRTLRSMAKPSNPQQRQKYKDVYSMLRADCVLHSAWQVDSIHIARGSSSPYTILMSTPLALALALVKPGAKPASKS